MIDAALRRARAQHVARLRREYPRRVKPYAPRRADIFAVDHERNPGRPYGLLARVIRKPGDFGRALATETCIACGQIVRIKRDKSGNPVYFREYAARAAVELARDHAKAVDDH